MKRCRRGLGAIATGLAVVLFCSSAHAADKAGNRESIKIDGVREFLPEDIKKIEAAVNSDTLDLQNKIPDDYTNWAIVLSQVILAKEGGHKKLSNHALEKIMLQTRDVLHKLASGEAFDPTLAVTDDIFHDSLPAEYKYLNSKGDQAKDAGAPGPAPEQSAEEAPFPEEAKGAEFFKKGEKVVKKKKLFAKPQTLIAGIFRFKAFINYSPCVIQSQKFAAEFNTVGINIAPTGLLIKPEAVSLGIAGMNIAPSLITVAPSGVLVSPSGVEVAPALAGIIPAGIIVNPSGVFISPVQTAINPVGSLIGPTGIEVAPVDTLYSPRGRTSPDLVQAQAPALIAGTTYYVQHPEELKQAIAAFKRAHGDNSTDPSLPVGP